MKYRVTGTIYESEPVDLIVEADSIEAAREQIEGKHEDFLIQTICEDRSTSAPQVATMHSSSPMERQCAKSGDSELASKVYRISYKVGIAVGVISLSVLFWFMVRDESKGLPLAVKFKEFGQAGVLAIAFGSALGAYLGIFVALMLRFIGIGGRATSTEWIRLLLWIVPAVIVYAAGIAFGAWDAPW